MSVEYRDRNYLVYKGNQKEYKDLLEVISNPKYRNSDEKTNTSIRKDIMFLRNYTHNKESDKYIIDYMIHFYRDYTYIFDFDIESLMKCKETEKDKEIIKSFYGGYYGFKDILQTVELNNQESYKLLPKLLSESNKNDLAYFLLELYTPDNLSYVMHDQKTNTLEAITIQNNNLPENNYDGVYYSITDKDEELFSNNPELLLEFSSNIEKLPENSLYKNQKVRKIKW